MAVATGKKMRWTPIRVQNLRARYAESQPAFAARLGVSVGWLRNFEHGDRVVPLYVGRLLDRLAEDAEQARPRPHPDPRYRRPD